MFEHQNFGNVLVSPAYLGDISKGKMCLCSMQNIDDDSELEELAKPYNAIVTQENASLVSRESESVGHCHVASFCKSKSMWMDMETSLTSCESICAKALHDRDTKTKCKSCLCVKPSTIANIHSCPKACEKHINVGDNITKVGEKYANAELPSNAKKLISSNNIETCSGPIFANTAAIVKSLLMELKGSINSDDGRSTDQRITKNGLDYEEVGDFVISLRCKRCKTLDRPSNLLICDGCEDSYHVSCCYAKGKKIPTDEWYCHPCFKRRSKILEVSKETKQMFCSQNSKDMLKSNRRHISKVRLGNDYQAKVSEWSGPITSTDDYFDNPCELNQDEFTKLNDLEKNKQTSRANISNWVQCRGVTMGGEAICGKWRRAPLFVNQTDDWDCSCAVCWDPAHADCAVPQEMATEKVLEDLKLAKLIKLRLATRKRKSPQA